MTGEILVWFGAIAYQRFESPVRHYADILLTKIAPIFDDIDSEQERHAQSVLSRPSWHPEDYDQAVEAAYESSMDHAIEFMEMRSVFMATGVSGLFHLFEKQLFQHLNNELRNDLVHPITEWKDAVELIGKLTNRRGDGDPQELGRNFRQADLRELQLVANAVKHGKGRAYTSLQTMSARVVDPQRVKDDWTVGSFSPLAVPIVVEAADVERYRDAILQFWKTEGTYWASRSAFTK